MKSKILILIFTAVFVGMAGFLILYSGWIADPGFCSGNGITIEEIVYRGTLDGTYPLHAVACYKNRENMPIVVLMHEYSDGNDRFSLMDTAIRFAGRGFFVIVPDMRGRGKHAEANLATYNLSRMGLAAITRRMAVKVCAGLASFHFFRKPSAGKRDSSGKEIHDIIDGVEVAKARYRHFVDAGNVNIIGYSGGGGNTIAAVVKAPDYFNVAVSYFGISDYGRWYRSLRDEQIKEQLVKDVGGAPEEVPLKYESRNANLSASNNRATRIYLFVDEEDDLTPVQQSRMFCRKAVNCMMYASSRSDEMRFIHGNPSNVPDLIISENKYQSELRTKERKQSIENHRNFNVSGFIYYNGITVVIGKGDDSIFDLSWIEQEGGYELEVFKVRGRKNGYVITKRKDIEKITVRFNDGRKFNTIIRVEPNEKAEFSIE